MITKQNIIDYFKDTTQGDRYYSNPAEAAMNGEWDQPEDWSSVTSKSVDRYGGEDCGSDYYTVWQFDLEDGTTFFLRFDGWYASHYGCDYQDFREVSPKPVTKVEYV